MSILQGTILWSGFPGAPGYTNFHITNAGIFTTAVDNLVGAMNQFAMDIRTVLPNVVVLTASSEVKELDPATGALVSLNTSPVAGVPTSGTAGTLGPSPAGLCISWGTGGVNRGRRVRGRTFIVPLAFNAYESDGTPGAVYIAAANTAANNYRTSGGYESVIWSRPRLGVGGAAFPILSHHVTDQTAVLRSRRA